MLTRPKRKVCPSQHTSYPISEYDPFLRIASNNDEYTVFHIDGFIVTSSGEVKSMFMVLETSEHIDIPDIKDIITIIGFDQIKYSLLFAKSLGAIFRIFIWPDQYPENYNLDDKQILSLEIENEDGELRIHSYKMLSLNDLEKIIYKLRGRNFKFVKPLLSANTNVECYLANNTNNPWPGDIDAIIYDNKTALPKYIVEFKTHNQKTLTSEEYIGKYGPQDMRRFQVLFDLQKNIEIATGCRPKLLYTVRGTQDIPEHGLIKIDELSEGKVVNTSLAKRPDYNIFSPDLLTHLTSL